MIGFEEAVVDRFEKEFEIWHVTGSHSFNKDPQDPERPRSMGSLQE
jgi:hypothetical protein